MIRRWVAGVEAIALLAIGPAWFDFSGNWAQTMVLVGWTLVMALNRAAFAVSGNWERRRTE